MTELSILFLWHMHQPYYKDMVQGGCMMPWVRLHAIKGYMDMLAAVEAVPGTRVTFNLTPSLIRQLEEYAQGHTTDDFQVISEKPADELTPAERAFVLRHFFMANWDVMVRPYPEYQRLLGKRGAQPGADFEQIQKKFSDTEIRDLVVWYNLTWFGWAALAKWPELEELKRKGREFTEDDKQLVLSRQTEAVAGIIPAYRRLWDQGAIEVSASPMYHPILPLIYDSSLADRAHPGVPQPPRFRHPEDAVAQTGRGLAFIKEAMGRRPVGMWPSEGSVAHEIVPLLMDNEVRWVATDEHLLWKRVRSYRRDDALFHPWKVIEGGRELDVFFRDSGLSDLIGFNYSKQPPERAADDLVRRLREIRAAEARINQDHAVVTIALDGENPWESYPDGGKLFLNRLYQQIARTEGLATVTASEYLDRHPPTRVLDQMPTGSWISSNFDIWIGGPEENKAWDYLRRVRDDMPGLMEDMPQGVRDGAMDSLFAAEGSDWFWWYGDSFQSDLKAEFDYLFRLHLKNAYVILGAEPPAFLNEPVRFAHPVQAAEEPLDLISPAIDGKVTDYYEWRAAGRLNLRGSQGAMYQAVTRLKDIYFGFDLTNFYLRLDPQPGCEDCESLDVHLSIIGPRRLVIIFPFLKPQMARLCEERDDGVLEPVGDVGPIAADKIIELKAPFDALGLAPAQEVDFVIKLMDRDLEIERHPRDGYISFTVPDENFEARYWSV
ncbi:MAG TPA: glycoside hydrolase family 57 protein [bacterium]|nr:glycoside hydrolase family 57 protein [bacterium]